MGLFKSILDKAQAKKRELEKKAAQKAAEEAAALAIARGKKAALAAVEQAGKSLKSAGATIEEALFGPEGEESSAEAKSAPKAKPAPSTTEVAAVKAAEEARFEREVDEELAALKRRIGKP